MKLPARAVTFLKDREVRRQSAWQRKNRVVYTMGAPRIDWRDGLGIFRRIISN